MICLSNDLGKESIVLFRRSLDLPVEHQVKLVPSGKSAPVQLEANQIERFLEANL